MLCAHTRRVDLVAAADPDDEPTIVVGVADVRRHGLRQEDRVPGRKIGDRVVAARFDVGAVEDEPVLAAAADQQITAGTADEVVVSSATDELIIAEAPYSEAG